MPEQKNSVPEQKKLKGERRSDVLDAIQDNLAVWASIIVAALVFTLFINLQLPSDTESLVAIGIVVSVILVFAILGIGRVRYNRASARVTMARIKAEEEKVAAQQRPYDYDAQPYPAAQSTPYGIPTSWGSGAALDVDAGHTGYVPTLHTDEQLPASDPVAPRKGRPVLRNTESGSSRG